jgi:hexosaminidase
MTQLLGGAGMPVQSQAFPALHSKGAFSPSYFYSTEQIKDVVSYAAARGVRVMPEVTAAQAIYLS